MHPVIVMLVTVNENLLPQAHHHQLHQIPLICLMKRVVQATAVAMEDPLVQEEAAEKKMWFRVAITAGGYPHHHHLHHLLYQHQHNQLKGSSSSKEFLEATI